MRRFNKEAIVFEVLMILLAIVLLCFVTRLWPLLLLAILGILIAAIRLLHVAANKKPDSEQKPAFVPVMPRIETEQDVVRMAFGILQRRVTEQVISRYPDARWIWEAANAIERFAGEQPLTIMLNRAGGFRKAKVNVHCLKFCGLCYESADAETPIEPPTDIDSDSETENDNDGNEESVDYALIAYEWVEANMIALNSKCNDAIAEKQTTLLIPPADLPHADSWAGICSELTRNGFTGAEAQTDGINVLVPNNK